MDDQYREKAGETPVTEEKKEIPTQEEVGGSFYEGERQDLKENWEVLDELFDKDGMPKEIELTGEEKKERDKLILEANKAELDEGEIEKDYISLDSFSIKEDQIEELLDMAGKKGISHTIKVVEKTRDALMIDLWHAVLAKGRFYQRFKK